MRPPRVQPLGMVVGVVDDVSAEGVGAIEELESVVPPPDAELPNGLSAVEVEDDEEDEEEEFGEDARVAPDPKEPPRMPRALARCLLSPSV